jgi:thioredoxin 1
MALKEFTMSNEIVITGNNFETEVLQSPVPVLLDFWAPWCNPCRMIGPMVEQLADEYRGKAKIGKINIDQEGPLTERHGIVSIPTMLVYLNGEVVRRQSGALPKPAIEALFKDLI